MVIESSTTLEHNRQKTKLHSSSQILSLQLVSSLLVSHPCVCNDLLPEHFTERLTSQELLALAHTRLLFETLNIPKCPMFAV